MNLHLIDWLIVAAFVLGVVGVVSRTTRHMRSVADFLAAGRCAGRYLLTISAAMAGIGAISIVALWEQTYQVGYGAAWWANLLAPVYLVITLSGWVIYRYRQTRALTLAQFFELRYSRRFRVFAGLLAYLAGIINYGIFPAVGARFFIYFCGLPDWTVSLAGFELSLTYALVMAFLLGFALWITLSGGQIAIMISDCMQGVLCLLVACVVAAFCVRTFSWEQIGAAFQSVADPARNSMVNPFKTGAVRDFNIWYYLIGAFGAVYSCMAWQGSSGYNAAARSPHEARMASVLAVWRVGTLFVITSFLAICAFTVMHHPDFAPVAEAARQRLGTIASTTIQTQMTTPLVLSVLLPSGLMGLLCAVMLAAAVTTDDTYLHSWGSIFVQDVLMPFRKAPFTPAAHIRALRWSIVGVAVFAFFFSLLFRQTQYILMFFAVTGAIFAGGAGSAIVGGLYWKRGTTAAAWTAMIVGCTLALSGLALQQVPFGRVPIRIHAPGARAITVAGRPAARVADDWACDFRLMRRDQWQAARVVMVDAAGVSSTSTVYYAFGKPAGPPAFEPMMELQISPPDGAVVTPSTSPRRQAFVALRSLSGQVLYFIAMIGSALAYVVVSLFGRKAFDMDRLLHRGAHAVAADKAGAPALPATGWRRLVGLTPEFTRGDRIIYFGTMTWQLGWVAVFLTLLVINLIHIRSDAFWLTYFKAKFFIDLAVGVVTTCWFTAGGIRDIRAILRTLQTLVRNAQDDGRVVDHHNVGE